VREVINKGWDLMIAHPPCTHLAISGSRWWKNRKREQFEALEFVKTLMEADIPRIAIENPVSLISTIFRAPEQYIQPWMFGHGETKKTGLWLKNLHPLKPTRIVRGRKEKVHLMSPGPERWKNRSRTLAGIARAMAKQWGKTA
jgi:site-specific DNA-cytosine methylase